MVRKRVIYFVKILFFGFIFVPLFYSCGDKPISGVPAKPIGKPTGVKPPKVKYIDSLKEPTGLKIKWAKKGKGSKVKDGDVVLINYVVTLPNGKLVDGSSKITKSDLPFMVGYNMQTKGWDEMMRKMTVGDVATITLPAELGWSDNSLGEVLPANSDLILQLFVVKKIEPALTMNGSKIWRWSLKKNEKSDIAFGPKKSIKFNLLVNSQKEAGIVNTYSKKSIVSNRFEDEFQLPSLKKALTNAKKNQGIFILVSPQEVSQIKELKGKVKDSETLFYNIQVVDVAN